ncbi:SpoIID/LytB domain-containing protein [Prochlorococcus sp. MIT 1306]|uniref:SpoIID/LytB domain-containing protein n=1 Tax=Prochlorococcus sp. MIT 1306 TaxID=1799667 RepID=UPI0007BB32B8|nr:SpoIID/LytB domain-containing protein [Prochlorococcus sp. MIT 1306]KZR64208.1 Amidase enhancer precursor [Prochlorococcus sp. MIT 1306]
MKLQAHSFLYFSQAILACGLIVAIVNILLISINGFHQTKARNQLMQLLLEGGKPIRDDKSVSTNAKTVSSQPTPYFASQSSQDVNSLSLELRVGLISQSPPIQIKLKDSGFCKFHSGRMINEYTLNNMLKINKKQIADVKCVATDSSGIHVNNQAYRSKVYLVNRGNGWIAINQLSLEDYVASVVGAEMPSLWNIEALKAQAVAARSYALAHIARPANKDFHLGDTTRWQAYRGISSQTSRSTQATQATKGIVLRYKGGIVESLYASTADISLQAHGHLGASMSQHGAQQLARRGLKFNEILARYYTGASLVKLQSRGN